MGMLMLVSVSPACVFPLLPRSFCFGLLPLLLTLLVAPVIGDGRDEDDDEMLVLSCWEFVLILGFRCLQGRRQWQSQYSSLCIAVLLFSPSLCVLLLWICALLFLSSLL